MTQEEKAAIYDNCLRESDILQRENSKIKSEFVTNIPPQMQDIISRNEIKIHDLVVRLENLLR